VILFSSLVYNFGDKVGVQAMRDDIIRNKIEIFRLLESISEGVGAYDHKDVGKLRDCLSLLAKFRGSDELTLAVKKVFDLSGPWAWRQPPTNEGSVEIIEAVEEAISLLNNNT
jgi:hypothetical protein